jgi:L-alanine-DL-glutamate epimerase-like enolase superfamily enzyme
MVVIDRATASLIGFKLNAAVGGSGVASVDVIVVELEDSDGATGLGLSYVLGGDGGAALRAAQGQLESFITKKPIAAPRALWQRIAGTFNRTGLGVNLIGLAAVDTAVWDLHARRQGLSIGTAMGGQPRAVPVYGSGGFSATQRPEDAAETALVHVSRGLSAVKPRVSGQAGNGALLGKVRDTVGSSVHVMADANEKCDLPSAMRLLSIAADIDALFVEEPLPAHALNGYRALRQTSLVAIAAGEHMQDRTQMAALMSERIVAVLQPDLAMVGGLTPALDLAIAAELLGAAISPHFLPGLFVHLAAVSRSVSWIEDFPLIEPLFEGWPPIDNNGHMSPLPAAGHGLHLSDKALRLLGRG